MDLPNLKLNRFLYKNDTSVPAVGPVVMTETIKNDAKKNKRENSGNDASDAHNIITGTVITSCIIKSSNEDDRIEIGYSFPDTTGDPELQNSRVDYIAAYLHGEITTTITGFGITTQSMTINTLDVVRLFATQFYYDLVLQPVQFWFRFTLAGPVFIGNAAWTVSNPFTGVYTITHNLGSTNYAVQVTPNDNNAYGSTSSISANSFDIAIADATGTLMNSGWSLLVTVAP